MKDVLLKKSIFNHLEGEINFKFQVLNFRFPIETLGSFLKKFYKDYEQQAFLVQANKGISNLSLKKLSKSYLLSIPINNGTDEHMYLGLSDLMCFLILFDEPKPEDQNINKQQSKFFLTFEAEIIEKIFDYFYKNYCTSLSAKERKLLIKLKDVERTNLDPRYISKFQEALLINALNENNRIKRAKIVEALSFTDESIIVTDLAGNIIETNKNFEKSFRKSNKSSIREILPVGIFELSIKETIKNQSWSSELDLYTSKDRKEPLLVSSYLFKDELERPNGFVFTFKNITELKKLNNLNKQLILKLRERNIQLSEVNKRLLEADRIKSDLLSVVSHELKTPISTIMGFSELIANRDYDQNTIRNYAAEINHSAKSLDRLITDYLDVASNQFGVLQDKLFTVPVNLQELIKLSFLEQKNKFTDMQFNFELSCLGYEPIIISEVQNLEKLFGKLIDNAMKYSPEGGKISVKILNDSKKVTVSIADEGVGVTWEQAKQVFEPFYRVDNSITREFSGVGLGLAVCKKIVELYNGSIWCEPGINLGSVFYVTLPVNPHELNEKKQVEKIEKIELKEESNL